ncbi:thiamine phosphate synthase [Escherichia coli]
MKVEADVVAAIALGHRYNARLFINDYWRLAIKHQAYGVHLGRKICKPPISMPSARQACGWTFRHMTIWKSTSRWQHAPHIALDRCVPTQTKQMPSAPQGWNSLARHVERLADYPPWRSAVSVGTRACGDSNGCRQYRRRQRHYSSRKLAFGNGTVAGNCRSWR